MTGKFTNEYLISISHKVGKRSRRVGESLSKASTQLQTSSFQLLELFQWWGKQNRGGALRKHRSQLVSGLISKLRTSGKRNTQSAPGHPGGAVRVKTLFQEKKMQIQYTEN